MRLGRTEVYLGCQGWSEPDWNGVFYPRRLKAAERLASYAEAFDFAEIDSTFYAIPAAETVLGWKERTPPGFRFTAKLPQAITHDPDPGSGLPRRPLQGERWRDHLDLFLDNMRLLKEKLVALLVQLPPQWHWRPERVETLRTFLEALPTDLAWAVEFRHRGWLNDEVLDLLRTHRAAFTMQDLYYMPRHVATTSIDLAYIRLQGKRREIVVMDRLQIERDEALDFWAEVIRELVERGQRRIVLAANNHYQGFSPATIAALQRRLGLPVSTPPSRRTNQLPLDLNSNSTS